MSVEIKVERVNVGQTQNGKPKTGLLANGTWYNIFGAHPELDGKTVKLKPGKFQGWYDLEFIVEVFPTPPQAPPAQQASNANGNGHGIAWQDYATIARLAHDLAKELEPDHLEPEGENIVVKVDRSAARIALVQTVLVALRDGKIAPLEPDDAPF